MSQSLIGLIKKQFASFALRYMLIIEY